MMSRWINIGTGITFLITASVSYAQTTITGKYTAIGTGTAGYIPTINDASSGFLPSPFSTGNLTVGSTTAPTTFLMVNPVNGSSSLGTLTGTVAVAFNFYDPSNSTVTGVTYSSGANPATLSAGAVNVTANYILAYGNGTDCITWDVAPCSTTSANTTTIGDTIVVSFADGTVLDVNLYNWSDWTMYPNISFKLASGPAATPGGGAPVPEPASIGLFSAGIAGLALLRRRRYSRR